MTSAALADCSGARSDSASKARTRRTVFMKVAPSKKGVHPQDRDFNTNEVTKYRSRMKDLRQPAVQSTQALPTVLPIRASPLAPSIAVKSAVDSRSVPRESDRASFFVAAPDLLERRKLGAVQRRRRARGPKDHADVVAAGAVDRIPERPDFLRRHPVLRIQQHDGIDLACRKALQEQPKIDVHRNDQAGTTAHAFELAALQVSREATIVRACVFATERLPGEIIRLVGMHIDQAQQPLMKHFVERLR